MTRRADQQPWPPFKPHPSRTGPQWIAQAPSSRLDGPTTGPPLPSPASPIPLRLWDPLFTLEPTRAAPTLPPSINPSRANLTLINPPSPNPPPSTTLPIPLTLTPNHKRTHHHHGPRHRCLRRHSTRTPTRRCLYQAAAGRVSPIRDRCFTRGSSRVRLTLRRGHTRRRINTW